MQALETHAFHHGVALPNIFADGPWAFCHSLEDGKKINIIPPSKIVDRGGGGRFQGVGAEDAAMVVVVLNSLLWSKQGWSLRIPPWSWY